MAGGTATVLALVALVALLVLSVPVQGGTGAPTSDTTGQAADDASASSADGEASFSTSVFQTTQGDVARISVEMGEPVSGALATVSIGSKGETNYVTNVTVADSDGDGEVTLFFNTYTAGTHVRDRVFWAESGAVESWRGEDGEFVERLEARYGGAGVPAGSEGDLTNRSRARRALLAASNYQLQVVAHEEGRPVHNFSEETACSVGPDAVDDVGTLSLGTRRTDRSSLWVTPAGDVGEFDREYIRNNVGTSLTQSRIAATGEAVVHRVTATGLEGAIRNWTRHEGYTVEEAFLAENGRDGLWNASLTQLDSEANAARPSVRATAGNSQVVADLQRGRFWVALDLDDVGYEEPSLADGERWSASFATRGVLAGAPFENSEGVSSDWEFREARAPLATTADERLVVRNGPDQIIRSESGVTVAPGTELELYVDASDADVSPFIETLETIVGPDRTFSFRIDMDDRSAGTEFTAELLREDTRLSDSAEYDGEIRDLPQASVTFDDQTVAETDQVVTVDSVTLSEGGFVAVRKGEPSGPVVGVSSYHTSGRHTDVRIVLAEDVDSGTALVAMAHLDTNANNVYDFEGGSDSPDGPYTSGGVPVVDSATVSYDRAPVNFQVTGLSPTDVAVTQGDVIETVEATVENTGEREATQTVEYRVSGATIESQEVTLAPGEATVVTVGDLDTSVISPGSNTHGFYTEDDSTTAVLTVETLEPANFQVSGLSPTDVTVAQGDVIGQVKARVENSGGAGGTQIIEYRIGGRTVASKKLWLGGGEWTTVNLGSINTSSLSPSAYSHGVFSANDSVTATLTIEEPPTPTATATPTPRATQSPTEAPIPSVSTVRSTITPTATPSATPTIALPSEEGGARDPTGDENAGAGDGGDGGGGDDGPPLAMLGALVAVVGVGSAGLIWYRSGGDSASGAGRPESGSGGGATATDDAETAAAGADTAAGGRSAGANAAESTPGRRASSTASGATDRGHRATESRPGSGDRTPSQESDGTATPEGAAADAAGSGGQADHATAAGAFAAVCSAVGEADTVDESGPVHVYRGRIDGRQRAILALAPSADTPETADAFTSRTRTWNGIAKNPHVATVVETDTDPRPWLAFDPADGALSAHVADLDHEARVDAIREVTEGLRTASMYNVVHTGLDPETIVIGDDGAALADWGLTRAVERAGGESPVTPYTAPEQLREDEPEGVHTDVYRLGAVAYRLLTDRDPVGGADLETAILDGDVPEPSTVADLPPGVDDVLLTALSVDPADRHDSAYAFWTQLNGALR